MLHLSCQKNPSINFDNTVVGHLFSASSEKAIKSNLNTHHWSGHKNKLICLFTSLHSYYSNHCIPQLDGAAGILSLVLNDILLSFYHPQPCFLGLGWFYVLLSVSLFYIVLCLSKVTCWMYLCNMLFLARLSVCVSVACILCVYTVLLLGKCSCSCHFYTRDKFPFGKIKFHFITQKQ